MTELSAVLQALRQGDNFIILCHASPDGDTVGSGYALCRALHLLGKRARIECADPIPRQYAYFTERVEVQQFDADSVIAVDVADRKLLGELGERYGQVDVCIDHHLSNTGYAKLNLVVDAAANCENIFRVINELGVEIDSVIANALFTGITTDTGCFRYSSCTPETHRIAARLIELGADAGQINRVMFETKSRARIEVERLAMESISYHLGERCAMMSVTAEMRSMVQPGELEGIAALPRQIEGVLIGVTLRQMDGCYKVSIRTHEPVDASAICKRLGGGGHKRAAGCSLTLSLDEAKAAVLEAIKAECGDSL